MSPGASDRFMTMMKNIIKENESVEILEDIEAEIVVDRYLNTPVTDICMEFWSSYIPRNKYENKLLSLAVLYLSPPPTSTDVERLFSTAGDILTEERNILLPENSEKLLLCRENMSVSISSISAYLLF